MGRTHGALRSAGGAMRRLLATAFLVSVLSLQRGCEGSAADRECQDKADQFPAGMVAAWRVDDDGACWVQLNDTQNRPAGWFPADKLVR